MSAKWEKTGKTTGELTFEISTEEISKGLDIAFKRVKKNLRVPGFRKGHVSRVVFDQFYGEEALYEDAVNAVLPVCLLYTSPSPRDRQKSRMPSSA